MKACGDRINPDRCFWFPGLQPSMATLDSPVIEVTYRQLGQVQGIANPRDLDQTSRCPSVREVVALFSKGRLRNITSIFGNSDLGTPPPSLNSGFGFRALNLLSSKSKNSKRRCFSGSGAISVSRKVLVWLPWSHLRGIQTAKPPTCL